MNWLHNLREAYEDWLWKYGPERVELARDRLEMHRRSIKEGTKSPYLQPYK